MNSDFRDADIRATLGSYSEVVTDGDPVLKSGAGAAFGRAWEASNRAKAGFSLVEILGQKDRGRCRELGPPERLWARPSALCARPSGPGRWRRRPRTPGRPLRCFGCGTRTFRRAPGRSKAVSQWRQSFARRSGDANAASHAAGQARHSSSMS